MNMSPQLLQEVSLFDGFISHLYGQRVAFIGSIPDVLRDKFQKFERISVEITQQKRLDGLEMFAEDKVLGQLNEIPLKSGIFDVVLAYEALENAQSLEDLVKEIWRILIPHGVAIFIGSNMTRSHGLFQEFLRPRKESVNLNEHYVLRDFVEAMQKQQFSLEQQQTFLFHRHCSKITRYEKIARKWFSHWGRRYFILVRKNIACLTPMKLSWSLEVSHSGIVPSASNIQNLP